MADFFEVLRSRLPEGMTLTVEPTTANMANTDSAEGGWTLFISVISGIITAILLFFTTRKGCEILLNERRAARAVYYLDVFGVTVLGYTALSKGLGVGAIGDSCFSEQSSGIDKCIGVGSVQAFRAIAAYYGAIRYLEFNSRRREVGGEDARLIAP